MNHVCFKVKDGSVATFAHSGSKSSKRFSILNFCLSSANHDGVIGRPGYSMLCKLTVVQSDGAYGPGVARRV